MKDILKNRYLWTVAGTLITLLLIHLCNPKTEIRYNEPEKTKPKDTLHPREFKPESPLPTIVPGQVQKYKTIKKAKRKAIEKQTEIIEQVVIENKPTGGEELKITKIDSLGQETTEVFDIPEEVKKEVIDSVGVVHIKEKTGAGKVIQAIKKFTKNGLIIIGGAAVVAGTAIIGAPLIAVAVVGVATTAIVIVIIKSDK